MRNNNFKNQKRFAYIQQLFAEESALQKEISAKALADGRPINISAVEGKILQVLAKSINAKKIAEIGTLYGYSSLWLAASLPENGTLYSIEKDENNFRIASGFVSRSDFAGKIKLLNGAATIKLKEIEGDGPFDLVFIDADKAAYPEYLDWAEKNIRKGGFIIGDNTFLFGAVYGEVEGQKPSTIKKMQEFNERLADKNKYSSIIIPTDEGMTVAQKLV